MPLLDNACEAASCRHDVGIRSEKQARSRREAGACEIVGWAHTPRTRGKSPCSMTYRYYRKQEDTSRFVTHRSATSASSDLQTGVIRTIKLIQWILKCIDPSLKTEQMTKCKALPCDSRGSISKKEITLAQTKAE